MYYNVCPHCGVNLDPNERCDCQEQPTLDNPQNNEKKAVCHRCGAEMTAKSARKMYCDKCVDIVHREQKRARYVQRKQNKQNDVNLDVQRTQVSSNAAIIAEQAREAGMSYGKYVARMFSEGIGK